MAIMNEKQMSIEQVRAMIENMHASLEELEKLLTESIWKEDTKWQFPSSHLPFCHLSFYHLFRHFVIWFAKVLLFLQLCNSLQQIFAL